jgi:hypothetical protein
MSGSISDWNALFREAYDALIPGGWLEMQEFDVWFSSEEGELPETSMISEWQRHLDEASCLFGKRLNVAGELRQRMVDSGFTEVKDDVLKVCFLFPIP